MFRSWNIDVRLFIEYIQSVAQFHLEKLIPDERFNDGTLVVSPCNSPEQAPVTFGTLLIEQMQRSTCTEIAPQDAHIRNNLSGNC